MDRVSSSVQSADLAHVDQLLVKDFCQHVRIEQRTVHGRCVTAARKLYSGAQIYSRGGQWLSALTQHSMQKAPDLHYEDMEFIGFLAHGCDPNGAFLFDPPRLVLLRDVDAGDLLTIDYEVTEDQLARSFTCACGSPKCRGVIGGRKAPAEEQSANTAK